MLCLCRHLPPFASLASIAYYLVGGLCSLLVFEPTTSGDGGFVEGNGIGGRGVEARAININTGGERERKRNQMRDKPPRLDPLLKQDLDGC